MKDDIYADDGVPTAAAMSSNPLSYPKSSEPFDAKLFRNPTSEYRGCPFWAWNTKLDRDQLTRQIDVFKEMGFGGFHMHSRVGLDTEYLGEEFMGMVRHCVDYAEEKGMMACLYDEDRWPSGSVGGELIKQYPEHKSKHLLFTPHPYGAVGLPTDFSAASAQSCRSENGHLLGRYAIELDKKGCLKSSRLLSEDAEVAHHDNVWYAYVETNPSDPWFNDQTYIDTLKPEALARFIEITHERYKQKVGDKFGTTVPCIFTDEPQFSFKGRLGNPHAKQDIAMPWTDDLPKTFKGAFPSSDTDLIRNLPQLFWDLPNGQPSVTRYQYHDHVAERFASAFMDQIAGWCASNGIMLDGHMMEEPSLQSQTAAIGEAMRCYRSMQMPGMDLLVDGKEYNTAKQVSSVGRQNGLRGAMSEIYGCTHWYFSFEGHKGCGDWHAALGITFRVQHLSWVSMKGEGKRDYPASINYQSPWYKEYGYVEDHFARVGVAMTRGHAVTQVGVIHPIESFWLDYGPHRDGKEAGAWRDAAFSDLTDWLLHGLVDFDFVAESLLPGQFGGIDKNNKALRVGHCQYKVIIAPNLQTIRSTTLKILRAFTEAGGQVIFAGRSPQYIDAGVPMSSIDDAIPLASKVDWDRSKILSALEPYRDINVFASRGSGLVPADRLMYQMRQDGDERFVFICNTDRNNPICDQDDPLFYIRGSWDVELLDTLSGGQSTIETVSPLNPSVYKPDWTAFKHRVDGCGSVLLRLTPSKATQSLPMTPSPQSAAPAKCQRIDIVSVNLDQVTLSEKNVLMLDRATWSFGDLPASKPQEILQLDNDIRAKLGLPRKGSAFRQPWTLTPRERAAKAHVKLTFTFESAITTASPAVDSYLAFEPEPDMFIYMNGKAIYSPDTDESTMTWWVDESIKVVPIPKDAVKHGINKMTVDVPFGLPTNMERMYILGDFNVDVDGIRTIVKPIPASSKAGRGLTWGNLTAQHLPFYVGNATYRINFTLPSKSHAKLSVPHFSSPVLLVCESETGKKIGHIAFQPRQLDLGVLEAGRHSYDITAFGDRFNSFGHLHLPEDRTGGCSPDVWRSKGWAWQDDYYLRATGILAEPKIFALPISGGDERDADADDTWVVVGEGGEQMGGLRYTGEGSPGVTAAAARRAFGFSAVDRVSVGFRAG